MSGWPVSGHNSNWALHRCDTFINEVPFPSELNIKNRLLLTGSSRIKSIVRLQKPSDVPVAT